MYLFYDLIEIRKITASIIVEITAFEIMETRPIARKEKPRLLAGVDHDRAGRPDQRA
jgi:hypothetical protein